MPQKLEEAVSGVLLDPRVVHALRQHYNSEVLQYRLKWFPSSFDGMWVVVAVDCNDRAVDRLTDLKKLIATAFCLSFFPQ
ncbi:MAG: hypothetical protein QGG71_18135 [Pirellulaceae bacterium]|nr:hypothetical protein [Planctomycetaceae bacterium]MDP6556596.1 hypothetical protein [Pirellulaceae bacterium]